MYTTLDDEELVLDVFPDATEEDIIDLLEALQSSAPSTTESLRSRLYKLSAHSSGNIAAALACAWNEGVLD